VLLVQESLLDVFAESLERSSSSGLWAMPTWRTMRCLTFWPSRKDWTIWTDCLGELEVDLTRMNMGKTVMFTSMLVNQKYQLGNTNRYAQYHQKNDS